MSRSADIIKKSFFSFSSLLPFNSLIKKSGSSLFVPIYHAIANANLPHLKHILPHTPKTPRAFEKDLDNLLKYVKPVSLETIINSRRQNAPLPEKSFHISFDDGLRQAYEFAAPVLYQKGIPATFFINNAAVDNQYLLYRHKISLLIEHVQNNKLENELNRFFSQHRTQSNTSSEQFLLGLNYQQENVINSIALAVGLEWNDYLQKEKPYMTMEQLKELQNKGFTLGGHTVHHAPLWQLSLSEAVNEVAESVRQICNEFKLGYSVFAFPFTDAKITSGFFEALKKEIQVDLFFGSQKLQGDVIPNMIHRFDGDNNMLEMDTYLKSLLTFQYYKQLRGNAVFKRK